MDLRMPSVNGLFGYRALQAIIGFESVPIIAVPADYTSRAKSEAIYSFLRTSPFSRAVSGDPSYGHAPYKLCTRSLSKNRLGGDSFLARSSEEHA